MSLINDALKKAQSLQAAAQQQAHAPTPAPEPVAVTATTSTSPVPLRLGPAPTATVSASAPTPARPRWPAAHSATTQATTPLKLSLTPPAAPAVAKAPADVPAPAAASATAQAVAPIRLSLATPPAPPAMPAPINGPSIAPAVTLPLPAALAAAPQTPAIAPSSPASTPEAPPSIESLRLQYKQADADAPTLGEQAGAATVPAPEGLTLRPSPAEAAAPAAPTTTVPAPVLGIALQSPAAAGQTASIPPPASTTPPKISPVTGLRMPTPEAAAAFLASNPAPAHAGVPAPVAAPSILDLPLTTDTATPPPVPDKPRQAPSQRGLRRKAANPESILLMVGGVLAVLLGGGLTAAYLFLREPPKKATAPEPAETEEMIDESLPEDSPYGDDALMAADDSSTPVEPADSSTPSETLDSPAPQVHPPGAIATSGTTYPTQASAAPQPAEPPPPHVNRPDPTIQAWVQKIELTGIRSGAIAKVFMNGKLYEVGETVNYDMGLKLVGVTGKVLNFEDAEGNTYEYRF